MPELPEVESARRRLVAAATGKTIAALRVHHRSHAAAVSARERRAVRGARIEQIERRGKHQLISLSNGRVIHVHFRMSGDWTIRRSTEGRHLYARAEIELTDGTTLALIDPRALSTITVHKDGTTALPALGPEPLDTAFTAEALRRALARRRGSIKLALLDQRVVAGIGNIYAVEALWCARIDPRTAAARLGPVRAMRLIRAIRIVLNRAIAAALRDDEAASPTFAVYDREGEHCRRCSARIRRIVQAGRSTYFCPGCQRR